LCQYTNTSKDRNKSCHEDKNIKKKLFCGGTAKKWGGVGNAHQNKNNNLKGFKSGS